MSPEHLLGLRLTSLRRLEVAAERAWNRPAKMEGLLAGVDIGGRKIAVGLADHEGRVIATRRAALAPEGGPQVVPQVIGLLEEVIGIAGAQTAAVACLGAAVPAVIDAGRGVVLWAPNIAGWQQETPLAGPLAEATGLPTSLHYDGHAWVVGEWWCGAARGARDVALVAVGTGIGGGIILDGRLHRGRIGAAGAVGWWVADWHDVGGARPERIGWLESLASGPAIARATGIASAEEALAAARRGDPRAAKAVEQAARALGAAVANLVSLLDPEVVVLAGGVIGGGADLILPIVREVVGRESQPQIAAGVRIVPAERGEDAGWLGAAKLAYRQLEEGKESL